MTHSLVIPVYRNEESIDALIAVVAAIQDRVGQPVEAVFVVDGSPDRCFELLRFRLPTAPFPSQLVLLSRNFGSFAAIRVGLEKASGSLIAVMSADLQEPADLIVEMFAKLQSGDSDVVVGIRIGRNDPFLRRVASRIFWGLYRRMVLPEMPPGGVDVFGCTSAIRDQLLRLKEARSSLVGQLFWLGFRRSEVPYQRMPRHAGRSTWTLRKRLNYLTDSVYAFTDLPIRILTVTGLVGILVSVAFGSITLVARLLGWFSVPGYTVTVGLLLFFGSLNLFGLGLVGSYAWRGYENTKARPVAIPMLAERFGGKHDT